MAIYDPTIRLDFSEFQGKQVRITYPKRPELKGRPSSYVVGMVLKTDYVNVSGHHCLSVAVQETNSPVLKSMAVFNIFHDNILKIEEAISGDVDSYYDAILNQ